MEKKVLLVDDSAAMLSFLSKVFKPSYEVIDKNSAVAALSSLHEGNIPDLIITDINMPVLNGIEFVEKLKADINLSQIPVIVLSGNQESADKLKMLKMGVDDYVVKPFNPEELSVRAERVVDRVRKHAGKNRAIA